MNSVRALNTLAALTWYAGAAALLPKGIGLLLEAEAVDANRVWPWAAFAVGVLIGVLKARVFLYKSCRKNLTRIAQLQNPRWWQFFRPQFFGLLAVMITLGVTASRLAEGHYASLCVVGAVDLSVGTGLLVSGVAFFRTRPIASSSAVVGD